MINYFIRNVCLISFALFGPIYLPSAGVQRTLKEYSIFDNSRQITLNSKCALYCFPEISSKKLRILKTGSTVSILRVWQAPNNKKWIRVQISSNALIKNFENHKRGWITI